MVGSISTLGVGSGLQLQDMLDQLRSIDEKGVSRQREQVANLNVQLDRFTKVSNQLLGIRSSALSLSLTSTFIDRALTSGNPAVLSATVASGTPVQSREVVVSSLATRSTWQSAGLAALSSIVHVPTSRESTTGVMDPGGDLVMAAGESMTVTFGADKTVTVTADPEGAGLTMDELVAAINDHGDNQGGPGDNGRYVTAETFQVGDEWFLRVRTDTAGGTGEANRVSISQPPAGLGFAAPKALFSFTAGSGDPISLNVSADTTLSQLAGLINNQTASSGVTASIINDGSAADPYRLILRAENSGLTHEISFASQLPDLALSVLGASGEGLNARFSIDGVSYQRQKNSGITDVLEGVTLKLEGVGSSSLTIAGNDSRITELVTKLVEAYNGTVQAVKAETGYDQQTQKFGALAATTLRGLPHDLQGLMTSTVKTQPAAKVTSLFDLGLAFEKDGSITFDATVLQRMVAEHPEAVEDFFLGDSEKNITGFADLVTGRMQAILGSGGQIEAERSAARTRIAGLETQIESSLVRLDRRYEVLAKQFVELDRYMNQMTSISNYLTGQFESMSKMWNAGGRNK